MAMTGELTLMGKAPKLGLGWIIRIKMDRQPLHSSPMLVLSPGSQSWWHQREGKGMDGRFSADDPSDRSSTSASLL